MQKSLHRRARTLVAAGIGVVLVAAGLIPSAASAAESPSTVSIDLEGTWKFATGDDPAYADPSFDDSSWADQTVPEDGANFASYDGFGWYRLTFDLPSEASGQNLVASLGFLDDVDEAFLNGVRIGGSGTMPPNASSQWFEKRLYPVPSTAPVFGGENVLAVRVYDMNGGGGWYQGPVGIYSKDAVRATVYGIDGDYASSSQTAAVTAVLAAQKAALATGDVDGFLATLDEDYFHDGRTKERRERELRAWMAESGSLTLTDGEVEVVVGDGGDLIVDTNRTITGTREGAAFTFQPAAQEFLHIDAESLLETGNASRFFREAVDSELEGQPREFVTYLPPSYLDDPDRDYPVVYLFHGINGGSREWEPRNIDDVLDGLWAGGLAESIVIMPDGESLWYIDNPGGVPWRSMFLTELMPLVDGEYRTLDSADFRGTTGISMGGFGAYSIGLSHPELFSSVASHIGALSVARGAVPSPLTQVASMSTDELNHFSFFYDSCEYDEYRFDEAVRTLDTTLTEKGVAYTSAVYPEGRHNDDCWMPHLVDSFTVHSDSFRSHGLEEGSTNPPTDPTDPDPGTPVTTLTVDDAAPTAGASLTVSGSGFVSGESVTIELRSDPVVLAEVSADDAGAFTRSVTIPADTTPGAHTVVATGESGRSASIALTVAAADDSGTDTGSTPGTTDDGDSGGDSGGGSSADGSTASAGSLPLTGVDPVPAILAALILLSLGTAIVVVRARRSS
ncbi:alpha/beta hydrolase [Microbacterium xanthum]|uniref:alpha/beta hydrolase n=1 Tax=Microbacterium xanthum TaxID=3079794 RepID=UPI002AD2AC88|nr:alpha/beta hydrolase-fold protein [Microbacterium sp. KSW-48]MDZ8170778.1 alpha/beta hydrolase-fold protein [Microbacterium sp. KSW-48]